MTIPVKVKLLTPTAKMPEQSNEGDLYDLFADDFGDKYKAETQWVTSFFNKVILEPKGRVLIKTGIALELPKQYDYCNADTSFKIQKWWIFDNDFNGDASYSLASYAVVDLRPLRPPSKHGITILNSPATNRKEIRVMLCNAGHEPYTIKKGDKIAQMLIRPLYPSKLIQVEDFEDTGRGGYGSTGK